MHGFYFNSIVSQLIKRSPTVSVQCAVILFLWFYFYENAWFKKKKIIIFLLFHQKSSRSTKQTYTLLPTDTNHEEKGYLKVAKLMKESENILVVKNILWFLCFLCSMESTLE
jgi:hypothetical protein